MESSFILYCCSNHPRTQKMAVSCLLSSGYCFIYLLSLVFTS